MEKMFYIIKVESYIFINYFNILFKIVSMSIVIDRIEYYKTKNSPLKKFR